MKSAEWQQRSSRMKTTKVLTKLDRFEAKSLDSSRRMEHRKKYGKLYKSNTATGLVEREYFMSHRKCHNTRASRKPFLKIKNLY